MIYKIVTQDEWGTAMSAGRYKGSADDVRDGFIHFSTAAQLAETATRHFAGQDNLLVVAIAVQTLGDDLKWEISRNGRRFPHLYGSFATDQVETVAPLDEWTNV